VLREETLAYGLGRIREVRQGPDGYIYLAISDGNGAGRGDFEATAIMRLEPAD
jgi:glucose/arabinose dehydrogenase